MTAPAPDPAPAPARAPGAAPAPDPEASRLRVPAALRALGIDGAAAWSIPMTTRFRRITVREGVLLHGPAGWAEFSPFADYDADESSAWLRAALEDALHERPAPRRGRIPVNATIPVVAPDRARRIAASLGACTAKVKVADPGTSLDADAERLAAVRDELGADARIRIDANAAWTLPEALAAIPVLDRAAGGLEYVEQPVASLEDMAALRRRVGVPLAADELVRRAEDPLRVARAGAADLLVMKVQPLGGARRCLQLAQEAGLPVVVSSALESSVGIGAGIALAAALPELPSACGLATTSLLTGDLTEQTLRSESGSIPVTRPAVDPELLARHAASAARARSWQRRLEECTARLAA